MVDRRVIIGIGDQECAGRLAGTLSGPNAAYSATQTDYRVWNSNTSAWEDYTAGQNSHTLNGVSTVYGPEVSIRRDAPAGAFQVDEDLHLIKLGFDSSTLLSTNTALDRAGGAQAGTNFSCLWPEAREAYTTIYQQASTALTALTTGGDTAVFDGIYVILGEQDSLSEEGHAAYGALIEGLVNQLKSDLNIGASVKVVLLKPHLKQASDNDHIQIIREQMEALAYRRSEYVTVQLDNATLSANEYVQDDIVAIGQRITAQLFVQPATVLAPTEPSDPIDLYVIAGDDELEGPASGTELSTYLQSSLSGVQVWQTAQFQTLSYNVNNLSTETQGSGIFGPMIGFADQVRQSLGRTAYILKLCYNGSTAQEWFSTRLQELLMGKLRDAVDTLENTFGADRVRLRGMVFSAGNKDSETDMVGERVAGTIAAVRQAARTWRLTNDGEVLPVSLLMSRATAAVRSELQNVGKPDNKVFLVDDAALAVSVATGAGAVKMGRESLEALSTTVSQTNPTFCPSREFLLDRLRLDSVPDINDVHGLIDQAIDDVRTGFYRRIGSDRISYLQSLPASQSVSTEADFMRTLAVNTEVKWVRLELMRTLGMQFVAGSASNQIWNEESVRDVTLAAMAEERRMIQKEIDNNNDVLAARIQPNEIGGFRIVTISPTETPPKPLDSIRAKGGVL